MAASAVKSFVTLEEAASRAASRVDGEFSVVRDQIMRTAQQISTSIPLSAVEITKGMEELIKAGSTMEFAALSITHLAKTAVGGGLELNETISRVTDTFFGFGLATGKASHDLMNLQKTSDIISKTADISKASFESMSESFVTAAAAAKIHNIELTEAAAVLAGYAQAGIKGTEAGTKFQMAIRDLTTTAKKHSDVWDAVLGPGSVYDETTGELNSIVDILTTLQEKTKGLTEEAQKDLFIALELPSRAFHATAALFGLQRSIRDFQTEIEAAGGHVDSVFNKQMQAAANQLRLLKNQFDILVSSIGQMLMPVMFKLVAIVKAMIFAWQQLSATTKTQVILWAAFFAVLGPGLIILSVLIRSFHVIGALIFLMVRGVWTLIASLAVLIVRLLTVAVVSVVTWLAGLGPIGWVTLGILAILALLEIFYFKFANIRKLWKWVSEGVVSATKWMVDQVELLFEDMVAKIDEMMADLGKDFGLDALQKAQENVEKFFQNTIASATVAAGAMGASMAGAITGAMAAAGLRGELVGDIPSGFPGTDVFPPGTEDLELPEEVEQHQHAAGSQQFSASELGSVEEAANRAKGQNQLVTIGQHQLNEQKKTNIKLDITNKSLDDLDGAVRNFGNFKEANV